VQSQTTDAALRVKTKSGAGDAGLVPLVRPYAISTAPHFAVLVQFPKADSIRRIALGDSNYFLAEADKDDPHYAIVKQIRTSSEKGKSPIKTNMLVYMASGRVINIMLKSDKLADTAYSIDYPVGESQPPSIPVVLPALSAEAKRERDRADLIASMLNEVKENPKTQNVVVAGGLTLHYYRIERLDDLALVSFDVENTSSQVIDLEEPQVNLVTDSDKSKDRKKNVPAKVEPIPLSECVVSIKQLPPGGQAVGLVAFKPPVHDSDQGIYLSLFNRAMADQPARYRIE
jgi:hypothetical protein